MRNAASGDEKDRSKEDCVVGEFVAVARLVSLLKDYEVKQVSVALSDTSTGDLRIHRRRR
jgi:hypothetical protein